MLSTRLKNFIQKTDIIGALIARRTLFFKTADILLSMAAFFFAFLLRFEGTLPRQYYANFLYYLLIFTGLNLIFLHYERLYAFSWSYVGLKELAKLWKALTYAAVIFMLLIFIDRDTFGFFAGFPRSVVLLSYLISLIFIGGLRISKRLWSEFKTGSLSSIGEPTLIVGAGRQGEHLIRHLQNARSIYRVIGIVDSSPTNQGISVHGVPVLGFLENIPKIVHDHDIRHIIIALESDHARDVRKTTQLAREAGVIDIKIIPEYSELLGQALSFRDLKEISIEDLLGREPAKIDTGEIKKFLHGKKIMVTGAAGSIGSELCRQISQFLPDKLLLLDFNESGLFDLENELRRSFPNAEFKTIIANVGDKQKIETVIADHRPEIIFHAAAYKHVPLMENHPEEAAKINILGTSYLAEAAVKYGVKKFVFISTDKAVKPVSVMGKTKRAAEIIVKTLNENGSTKFVSVRFGNVLASRGSVIPLFQEQIRRGGPVTVTHPDMVRYFMTIPEAALLVMEAGAVGKGGEVFILDMGKPIKIIELAKELIRISGYTPDVDIPIAITGIRPGEKIFEELLTKAEGTTATKWEKIFIAKVENSVSRKEIESRLHNLESYFKKPEQSKEKILKVIDKFIEF